MNDKITLGKIVNTFGLKGEVKVYSSTDFPKKRFQKGNKVFLYHDETKDLKEEIVASSRLDGDMIYVSFLHLDDINLVEKYKGYFIQVDKESLHPLGENTFYFHELIGCTVMNEQQQIGKVIAIVNYGAQDLLKIELADQKTILYPFIDRFLSKVDVENKVIYLNPIEGLLP